MLDAMVDRTGSVPGDGLEDRLARALLMRAETGLVALDGQGRVALANEAAREMLGLPDQNVRGVGLPTLVRRSARFGADADSVERWLDADVLKPLILRTAESADTAAALSIVPASGPDGHRLLVLKPAVPAPAPAMRKDQLTGLCDRESFSERLAASLAQPGGKPMLLLIDLDRFKAVNDSLGHPVGDALLQVVARRLTAALRGADVISRLSGDEFAIVMKRARDPASVGRRLVTLLSRPYLIEGSTVSVGASVGIALGPEHGADPVALIRAADIALYAAKNGGRNTARLFDAELEATTKQRVMVAEALRQAIPSGQFVLHFQPQMMLDTGGLTGFEAFLRWHHPELGMMMPPSFLPIAEATGMIWPIGEWVLHQACAEAARWPSHLSVSVNISAQQLLDRNRLPRLVRNALARSGLAAHRLELEVPESALTQHGETATVLAAVDALGVRVSLDDFGTGYSSLNHLRRFPLHKLKIDHSFIQALGVSEEASDVVRAVTALGRTLGVVTAAEGVETLDQQARVRLDGCKAIQGYVLSPPVPASEVAGVIRALGGAVYKEVEMP